MTEAANNAADNIAYGGVMLALFGNTKSLSRFQLPLSSNGLPPWRHQINTEGVNHFNQRSLPICTAVAATTLVSLVCLTFGKQKEAPEPAPAFTYLMASRLVTQHENMSIESQLDGGLPLAACVEAVCLTGILPRKTVPHPDDPKALEGWIHSNNFNIDDIGRAHAYLPTDLRPIRLFPSEQNLKAVIIGGKAVAFSFRIGELINKWMRTPTIQRGSGYRIPPDVDLGPRLATHACVIVGFDDDEEAFRVRNSFGKHWGMDGDFWVPYATMLRPSFSASEFYTVG